MKIHYFQHVPFEEKEKIMPPYHKHLETSTQRTGNDHQAMHDWLDNHPDMKAEVTAWIN